MLRDIPATPAVRVAFGALVIAFGTTAWTLVRATRMEALPEVAPASFATAEALAVRGASAPTDIRAAVETDPFQENRTGPSVRYRMPGETDQAKAAPTPERELPVVLGTALAPDGTSFAMCQMPGGRAGVVHVGDKVGEYTVKSIERGHVVFTAGNGKQLDIPALR